MRDPAFWWQEPGAASLLLSPVAALYSAIASGRLAGRGARAALPVICVGNFTVGGAGKTPAAIALARMLAEAGRKPALLSRGYGGSLSGPVLVDPAKHTAAQVGDEALLLAQAAPTIVARERVAGARAAKEAGADVAVMDDGLQNPSLEKDFTIAVIDGRRGLGNGKVFPAGPLRAPIEAQLKRSDALLIVGEGTAPLSLASSGKRTFHARLVPDRAALAALAALASRKVLAFAGIGDPEKFFATLAATGIDVAHRKSFPDHHRYSAEEAANLIMQAEHEGLRLVTTAKDHARMAGNPDLAALASRAHVLPVTMEFAEAAELRALVFSKLRA